MSQNIGRSLKLDDPKASLEIDRLYQLLQQAQLESRNLHLDEVARAIGRVMKDGQLGVLNRVLEAPIDLPEVSTPTNPSSGIGRIFMRDNGSGKTQFCVIFPSGSVQVLATEV
jgi:hypothetical protein